MTNPTDLPGMPVTTLEVNEMKTFAAFVAATVLALLGGCNTMEGVGQDIQKGGGAIERSADKNNPTDPPGTKR